MNLGQIDKSPDDVLDYDVDFSRWLPSSDSVASANATIADSTATVAAPVITPNRVKLWVSGGAEGDSGTLTLIATTTQGRTIEVCFRLRVKGC